jgi:hypothetical protein
MVAIRDRQKLGKISKKKIAQISLKNSPSFYLKNDSDVAQRPGQKIPGPAKTQQNFQKKVAQMWPSAWAKKGLDPAQLRPSKNSGPGIGKLKKFCWGWATVFARSELPVVAICKFLFLDIEKNCA